MSTDMQRFTSRLRYRARLRFETAHRIGADRSLEVDAPDLPVLRTATGDPYIPGSSFKGAWRSYTESILRTLQDHPDVQNFRLACLSIAQPQKRKDVPDSRRRCLTLEEVRKIKEAKDLTAAEKDKYLRQGSCLTCQLFGNGWLAAKVMVKDLLLSPTSDARTEIRNGVGIDRDSGRAGTGLLYQFEAVAPHATFDLEILVENAAPAELGLVCIGLQAFARGDILLGGNKSRGLGWCRLEPAWDQSRYVNADNLLDYLRGGYDGAFDAASWSEKEREWINAFHDYLQQPPVEVPYA